MISNIASGESLRNHLLHKLPPLVSYPLSSSSTLYLFIKIQFDILLTYINRLTYFSFFFLFFPFLYNINQTISCNQTLLLDYRSQHHYHFFFNSQEKKKKKQFSAIDYNHFNFQFFLNVKIICVRQLIFYFCFGKTKIQICLIAFFFFFFLEDVK